MTQYPIALYYKSCFKAYTDFRQMLQTLDYVTQNMNRQDFVYHEWTSNKFYTNIGIKIHQH